MTPQEEQERYRYLQLKKKKVDTIPVEAAVEPEKQEFSQGFVKTYKGKPKTALQKADVAAGGTASFLLNMFNAPFEAVGEAITAPIENRAMIPPTVMGGEGAANPFSTVNKLLRAGAGAVSGIPGGTALNSARSSYHADRGTPGVIEDTALAALMGKVSPKVLSAPIDAATVGIQKTVKGATNLASGVTKKAISKGFNVPEESVAARFKNPEAIKNAGTAEKIALNDIPATGNKFKQVISGLSDEAKKTLSTSKFLEAQKAPSDSRTKTFYHITPEQNLSSIKSKGLVGGQKQTWGGDYNKVYLSDADTAEEIMIRMQDEGIKNLKMVEVKLNPDQIKRLKPDTRIPFNTETNQPRAFYSKENIGPETIKRVGNTYKDFPDELLDKGGAFTKDEVVGAIATAKRKLGGIYTAEGKAASKTLGNLTQDLKKTTNTISQNQVHDYITKLDEEIPWTKVWKSPESLTMEDHAMIDVRTKLDGLLKDRNPEYAKIMEPLSDAINTRNEFLKKFSLEKQRGGKYTPSDTTSSRVKSATKDDRLGTQRILGKVKETTGEDLLSKIENAQTLSDFQPSAGPRGDTFYSSVRNTLSSPPMAARIIDFLSKGKTGTGNVLSAINAKTQGTPIQEILKRLLAGQPAMSPLISGSRSIR